MSTLHIILMVIGLFLVIPMVFAAGAGVVGGGIFGLFMLFVGGSLIYFLLTVDWAAVGKVLVYLIAAGLVWQVILLIINSQVLPKRYMVALVSTLVLLGSFHFYGDEINAKLRPMGLFFISLPTVTGLALAVAMFVTTQYALRKLRASPNQKIVPPMGVRLLKVFTVASLVFVCFYVWRELIAA